VAEPPVTVARTPRSRADLQVLSGAAGGEPGPAWTSDENDRCDAGARKFDLNSRLGVAGRINGECLARRVDRGGCTRCVGRQAADDDLLVRDRVDTRDRWVREVGIDHET